MRRSEFIELGMRLAMIRKKLKMSQRRFAAACGMSNNYLCEVEKGQHQPGYDFLMRMVKKFKVNFNYLTTGEGPMFQAADAPAKEETKTKPVGKTAGTDKGEIEKMLWHMDHVPAVRYAVLEFFNRYLYDNKAMIEDALSEKQEPDQEKSKPEKAPRQ